MAGRRHDFGGLVMHYGGAPAPWTPPEIPEPLQPGGDTLNPGIQEMLDAMKNALAVCAKCQKHYRNPNGEPCPFCNRAELDALKSALGARAKPVEKIEELRAALRKALGALRDISRVTGAALEPLIAECEKALDT